MTQRRLRLLLAEGSPGEAAAALHPLYARNDAALGVDAIAPSAVVMRSRLEQHLAAHNQTPPCGPIHLRTSVGSWTPQNQGTFEEFLDGVESSLRMRRVEKMSEKVSQAQL